MSVSLYINEKETASMLGRSTEWLRANRGELERATGFPPIDPIVGRRHRPSIEAWAAARNSNLVKKVEQVEKPKLKGNIHAF